jgi:hypothetical protein
VARAAEDRDFRRLQRVIPSASRDVPVEHGEALCASRVFDRFVADPA